MNHLKNKLSKTLPAILIVLLVSFNSKPFALNGGTINNANIVVAANTEAAEITATAATGCTDTLTYQWQRSFDRENFIDIPGATTASYKPGLVTATSHLRRKAICQGGDFAYTTNVATIVVIP